jgi:ribosome-associated toxin RatA of RatAB toxin-antitoxin module
MIIIILSSSQFVPWCVDSRVLRHDAAAGYMEAELAVGVRTGPFTVREQYVSKIRLVPGKSVLVCLTTQSTVKSRFVEMTEMCCD